MWPFSIFKSIKPSKSKLKILQEQLEAGRILKVEPGVKR